MMDSVPNLLSILKIAIQVRNREKSYKTHIKKNKFPRTKKTNIHY